MRFVCPPLVLALLTCCLSPAIAQQKVPEGFTPLFNGKDLSGWHGEKTMDPRKWQALSADERERRKQEFEKDVKAHWSVEDGDLVNDGLGVYLTSDRSFGDMELLIEYKMVPKGDSGVYLRSTPQVQIWDPKARPQNAVGSGGLFNNQLYPSKPLVVADNPVGEWNQFRILQVGARTSVWLNKQLVVDHVIMEDYWDRQTKPASKKRPLIARGPIQLQTHGGEIRWRNVAVREIEPSEANKILASKGSMEFKPIFNGKDFEGWAGPLDNYEIKDEAIVCKPKKGGTIYTKQEFADFVARLEFKLPPGGNNGLAIRYPGKGNPAYDGMCELQVLDSEAPKYAGKLDKRQYHGSAYGISPAHRGCLRETGQWNFQEVTVQGSRVKVELNGYVILDEDLSKVTKYMANSPHPGKDLKSGHFGFAGHSDPVEFRNIQIKRLGDDEPQASK